MEFERMVLGVGHLHYDQVLMSESTRDLTPAVSLRFVKDATEMMECLQKRGQFASEGDWFPSIILAEISGGQNPFCEALEILRSHPRFRRVPLIVFSSQTSLDAIRYAYHSGANSYLIKPNDFDSLKLVLDTTLSYWLSVVKLPALPFQGSGEVEPK